MGKGRRGIRTKQMVQVAQERIHILYGLAEGEARSGQHDYMRRHVELASRLGMRYNVRMPSHLSRKTCKACHAFLLPGATARIRCHDGRVVQTCVLCSAVRRFPVRARPRNEHEG